MGLVVFPFHNITQDKKEMRGLRIPLALYKTNIISGGGMGHLLYATKQGVSDACTTTK